MSGADVYAILALDIGEQRTGVAIANSIARIASPLTTLTNPETLVEDVVRIVKEQNVKQLVVGLPRNMRGEDTLQTVFVKKTTVTIETATGLAAQYVDEALTSVKAEKELKARKKPYHKEDIDMLAATYILEDYLNQTREGLHV